MTYGRRPCRRTRELRNEATSQSWKQITNAEGFFEFRRCPSAGKAALLVIRLLRYMREGKQIERKDLCSKTDLHFLLDLAGLSAGSRTGV